MSDSFETPQTVARQAPPSMGFSRQEHWSGLPFPSPGDLSNPKRHKLKLTKHYYCEYLGKTELKYFYVIC
ncbi:hypothetical protein D9V42_14910 [Staphylococcus pseudoxylosus]|uniref:Uncharacterized protein n=1 Tax=Staphylococcus pseudoxylosus TaxID=2282419 RepID=A0AAQ0MGK7_9STAP|nr:hypothetical protein D9V42_14910 [Staphylococcus pseudoxylosus]